MTVPSARAQAPLTIEGASDRTTSDLVAWFRVPTSPGYTYQVLLDGRPVPTDLTNWVNQADYHEVFVARTNTASGAVTNRLVRFIVRSDRGDPEKGLIKWLPYPPIPSTAAELSSAQMRIITPEEYPLGLPIPMVIWLEDAQGNARRANGFVTASGFEANPIQVFRGAGSGMLPPATASGPLAYNATLPGLQRYKQINIESSTIWTTRSGALATSEVWPLNSRIHLTAGLTIPAGLSLTIGAGTIVKLNPLVNITNNGTVQIDGTVDQPVVLTSTNVVWPERNAGAWGGFVMNSGTARLVANGAIFSGGGGATSWSWPSGGGSHRSEQPVLSLWNGAKTYLTNCAIIHTAGQVGNGYNGDLTLDRTLFQRAITAGEYVGGTITINRSAVIEFPNDDGAMNGTIADADYDGIYFTTGTHILRDSLFGFAKDDVIDSGSGGAGTVLVTNCWVESGQHEAHAWSGGGRVTWTYDSVLMNSGQGIEAGWTEGSSDASPNVFAERLLTTANSVGARFGDNYDWTYLGRLRLTNSLILYNYRDIFLKTWNGTGSGWQSNSWVDRIQQTDLRSNFVSTAWTTHPGNVLWDPARDGWRLAHWMSTPPDAPVGIGFAVRTNQFAMTNLFDGVPVRLSSFTTNFVTVNYAFESGGTTWSTGALTFAPGETVKRIYPAGFGGQAPASVQAVVRSAVGGELTGRTNLTFAGAVPAVRVSLAVTTNQLSGPRIIEGVIVWLNTPSVEPVSLNYRYEASGATLASGTLLFNPVETSRQILPTLEVLGYEAVTLTVSSATNATLTGITSVTYSNAPLTMALGLSGAQQPLSTFSSGVPVILNSPAPAGVSVDFAVDMSGTLLTNGTLAFAAGDSAKSILAPTVNPAACDLLRVTLSNPVRATFSGLIEAYYVRTAPTVPPTNSTLIARGASTLWRYRATASDPGTTWRNNNFDDSSWPSGGAQLGFGESDQTTGIPDNRQRTSYFRHTFSVGDPSAFTNLSMWLLRDDGGVVYLNGQEAYRSPNLPQPPNVISYSTYTVGTNGENTIDTALLRASFLQVGANVAAVEIHQADATSSDVSFDFELIGFGAPPPPSPQPLYWGAFDGQNVLAWGDGRLGLQQSDRVTGPWTNVVGAVSPFYVTPGPGNTFFRLKQQ